MEVFIYLAYAIICAVAVLGGMYVAFFRANKMLKEKEYLYSCQSEGGQLQKSFEARNGIESAVIAESKARNVSPDVVIEELRHESNEAYTFLREQDKA